MLFPASRDIHLKTILELKRASCRFYIAQIDDTGTVDSEKGKIQGILIFSQGPGKNQYPALIVN